MCECDPEQSCNSGFDWQIERFAREADEWKTKCIKVEAEARKERGMREAFERKTADLEKLNDQLQQEHNVSYQVKWEQGWQ